MCLYYVIIILENKSMVKFMKCLNKNCDASEIEKDDNFCYKCGHWTSRGYAFLQKPENVESIFHGESAKKNDRLTLLIVFVSVLFIVFIFVILCRGEDIFKPLYYIKRKVDNYIYGYNTSIIKTDNIYNKKEIRNQKEALEFINFDMAKQEYKCSNSLNTFKIETELEKDYNIANVSFCDISYYEASKLKNVIDKIYLLFPNIEGALTNISITNAKTKSEYIAYFQPSYQFVNPNEDIKSYNKVNKTQILLNSYYFLNKNVINQNIEDVVGKNWYVNGATWESTLAHELGHYINFVIFLRNNGLENITFITENNENKVNTLIKIYDSGEFSKQILLQALDNYNNKYNMSLDLDSFALSISKYAAIRKKNVLIADETIAEAVHDYFLYGDNCNKSSYEIVSILKSRL